MTIMSKRGNLDNVVTYEHICDTTADMQQIDNKYVTLGSTCIVISGDTGGMEVYLADSNKNWTALGAISGGGSGSNAVDILNNDDLDENGIPNITSPTNNIIYLAPSANGYNQFIYSDGWQNVGTNNTASGLSAHAEGDETIASAKYSHAEGYKTTASQLQAHAEGNHTIASGSSSHAEGIETRASSPASHAEGEGTTASGYNAHAEGSDTTAVGHYAHAEGKGTIASRRAHHVFGEFNIDDAGEQLTRGTYVEIVGNGKSESRRANARTLDWNGNEWLAGGLTTVGTITIGSTTLTEAQLQSLLALLS